MFVVDLVGGLGWCGLDESHVGHCFDLCDLCCGC